MAPTESVSTAVVCDAGPLIHLDEISCLDLLADFHKIYIVEQVWEEVLKHRPRALNSCDVKLERIPSTTLDSVRFQTLVRTLGLHRGEVAALSLMHQHPEAIFLTDDAAARVAAKALNFRSYGTLGVLIRSIRRNQRTKSEVLETLQEIPSRSTLHISRSLLSKVVAEIEESD